VLGRVICISLLLFSLQSVCQEDMFLRLYSAKGHKIAKGYFFNTTDSTLILTNGKTNQEILVSHIDVIKGNRTLSHRIMITSLKIVSAALLVTVAVALSNTNRSGIWRMPKSKNKDPNVKRSRTVKPLKKYEINGDVQTWQKQRLLLHQL